MNLCILGGKVINEIDLKFIYNLQKKSLDKKHTAIIIIYLQLQDKQVIKLCAYDEIADYTYQNISEGDYIVVEGKIRNNFVEINKIYLIHLHEDT